MSAVTRSLVIPGWGQIYQEKNIRSAVLGIGFIGSVVGSVLYTNNYNAAVQDYNDIKAQYETAFDATILLI